MIRYFKRNEINISKYDACIETSINSRIYAYSWYLDIVADNWDVLVLNDYEAVMPLPWRQKYFIKYVYPPVWTQQLGIFSSLKMNAKLTKEFINSIPKKFKKITIQFNSENDLSLFKTEKRTNYILKLDKSYEEIYKNYRKDRKKSLRKSVEYNLTTNSDFSDKALFEIYGLAFPNLNFDKRNLKKLRVLIWYCINNNLGFQQNVCINKIKVASAFFLKKNNRIYYLFGASTIEGKKCGATTFLVDSIVKKYSFSSSFFDFEGSMMKGVSEFYKSFGVSREVYFNFQNYKF